MAVSFTLLPSNHGRWQHFVYRTTSVHGIYYAHWPNNPFVGFVDSCVPLLKIHASSSLHFITVSVCMLSAVASQLLICCWLLFELRWDALKELITHYIFSFNKREEKKEIRAYILLYSCERWSRWMQKMCRCVCVGSWLIWTSRRFHIVSKCQTHEA